MALVEPKTVRASIQKNWAKTIPSVNSHHYRLINRDWKQLRAANSDGGRPNHVGVEFNNRATHATMAPDVDIDRG